MCLWTPTALQRHAAVRDRKRNRGQRRGMPATVVCGTRRPLPGKRLYLRALVKWGTVDSLRYRHDIARRDLHDRGRWVRAQSGLSDHYHNRDGERDKKLSAAVPAGWSYV